LYRRTIEIHTSIGEGILTIEIQINNID
jgi:hypothetical protein